MSRELESVRFEADYWQALLADLRELVRLAPAAANPLPAIGVASLELLTGGDLVALTARISELARESMAAIGALGDPIDRIIALSEGRLVALREEAGLPPASA